MIILAVAILLHLTANPAVLLPPSTAFQDAPASAQSEELAEALKLTETVLSLYSAGKYDEAFPVAERVVKIRQRWLAKEDERLLSAMFNLALTQLARGKSSDAKGILEKILKTYEQLNGNDSTKLAIVLDQLGVAHYGLGETASAERAFVRALSVREKAATPNNHEIARSIRSLADFYQLQGRLEKAEPLYQRMIEVRKRQGTPELVSDAQQRYACVLRKMNREAEAEQIELEALDLSTSVPPSPMQSTGVVNGRALHLAQPPYPAEARAQRASGKVRVRIVIDEKGKVVLACAIEGPRQLMNASEAAAYRSRFSPTNVAGAPVRVSGIIIYNFVAQ